MKNSIMETVCFTPFHDPNPYISMMREAVALAGYESLDGESRISGHIGRVIGRIAGVFMCKIFHLKQNHTHSPR